MTEPASEKPAEVRAPKPVNKRGAARLAAVQALYQMDIAGSGLLETAAEYETFRLGQEVDGATYQPADAQWFRAIISGVVAEQTRIDPLIRDTLPPTWPLSRIDSTLRQILRAGAWELLHKRDVPPAVVITEYVQIADAFYDGEVPKLVNAVLDRIAKQRAQWDAKG